MIVDARNSKAGVPDRANIGAFWENRKVDRGIKKRVNHLFGKGEQREKKWMGGLVPLRAEGGGEQGYTNGVRIPQREPRVRGRRRKNSERTKGKETNWCAGINAKLDAKVVFSDRR